MVGFACSIFSKDGVEVVADTVSLGFLAGATVDYEDSLVSCCCSIFL